MLLVPLSLGRRWNWKRKAAPDDSRLRFFETEMPDKSLPGQTNRERQYSVDLRLCAPGKYAGWLAAPGLKSRTPPGEFVNFRLIADRWNAYMRK
jgi:hypothetical protein